MFGDRHFQTRFWGILYSAHHILYILFVYSPKCYYTHLFTQLYTNKHMPITSLIHINTHKYTLSRFSPLSGRSSFSSPSEPDGMSNVMQILQTFLPDGSTSRPRSFNFAWEVFNIAVCAQLSKGLLSLLKATLRSVSQSKPNLSSHLLQRLQQGPKLSITTC